MAYLKLLFSGSLMLIAAIISSSNANLKDWIRSREDPSLKNFNDILDKYKIHHYNIDLNLLDVGNVNEFRCVTTIMMYIKKGIRYIVLNSVNLNILHTTLTKNAEEEVIHPITTEYVKHADIFVVDLGNRSSCFDCPKTERWLTSGLYNLTINYTGPIRDNPGFFVSTHLNLKKEKMLVATNFYPTQAQRVFPCLDDPQKTATFEISVVHLMHYMAFSNMPIRDRYTVEYNIYLSKFDITPKISPHLVALIIMSDFFHFNIQNSYLFLHGRQKLITTFQFASLIFDIIDQREWKLPKNIPKVDFIAIPNYWYSSMHNLGLVFFRETDLIYDEQIDPGAHQSNIVRLISYAVAHQCINYFAVPYWSNLWFKEGLAVFDGAYKMDKIIPAYRLIHLLVVQTQQESLRLDTDLIMNPLISMTNDFSDFNSLFSFSYYIKAPIILKMMQQILPGDTFFEAVVNCNSLNEIFTNNSLSEIFKETIMRQFWLIMHNYAFGEKCPNITFSLHKDVIDTWTMQRHYPVLNVERDYFSNIMTIKADYNKWYIPFIYVMQSNPNFTQASDCDNVFWLTPKKRNLDIRGTIPGPGWIILNLRQAGYYRVNYDLLNWAFIIDYMNSENYGKIHVLNRAQLIDDSFNFMIAQKFPPFLFWKLTKYLWRETDYIAWYPMFKALEYMSSIFAFNFDWKLSHFKNIMANTFRLVLDNEGIKYEEISKENGFIRSLRLEALKWACIFETPTCLSNSTYHLRARITYFNNYYEYSRITANYTFKRHSAEWLEWIYCKGLMNSDEETWYTVIMMSNYSEIHEERVLEYLTCSKTSDIISNYWWIAINRNNIRIILSIIAKHANNNIVFKKIISTFYNIQLSKINKIALLSVIINNVYTDQQYNELIRNVVNILSTKVIIKGQLITLVVTEEEVEYIKLKISLRQSQVGRIYQKYEQYFRF